MRFQDAIVIFMMLCGSISLCAHSSRVRFTPSLCDQLYSCVVRILWPGDFIPLPTDASAWRSEEQSVGVCLERPRVEFKEATWGLYWGINTLLG